MRLACLFSGGKDSTYAAHLMEQAGHDVVVLVTVVPEDPHSWVFHTLNLEHLPEMAEAMAKDLIAVPSSGEEGADLEALERALSGLNVEGVVTGAIASDYQWDRINGVCQKLGLKVFSPLWRKDQLTILNDMLQAGMRAMIVGVYSDGLGQEWLGRTLDRGAVDELSALAKKKGLNVSGEGGEYETLVLDSPMHSYPLVPEDVQVEFSRDSGQLRIGRLAVSL
ncbi:MAG TPA: diphthine--ammonia ligase [Methanomassiliicoccales archaeon]|nr:diphthine--ammonia ligase [Methanomassiliicoccales archaeon]HQQ25664.1 diphthine--ammonia ligase [Methanomassiliicoccales archaeon]